MFTNNQQQKGQEEMAVSKEKTAELVKKYGRAQGDTGSPEVQVALITERLNDLNVHFKDNSKDHHSRRGLMKLVGLRRRLLRYLKSENEASYQKLIASLGIRR
jgi:small subunit ribosomal protein S15